MSDKLKQVPTLELETQELEMEKSAFEDKTQKIKEIENNRKSRFSLARRSAIRMKIKFNSQQKKSATARIAFKNLKQNQDNMSTSALSMTTHPPSVTHSSRSSLTASPAITPPLGQIVANEETPSPTVQRRNPNILLFQNRRSYTQMDMKQARRTGNIVMPPHPTLRELEVLSEALPSSNSTEFSLTPRQTDYVNKIITDADFYNMLQDRDPNLAGLKMYGAIMLNAYRKRRNEVKRLRQEVTDFQRVCTNSKNQLHVLNTLYRVEQKRNMDLSLQLKHSHEDMKDARNSCESLTTSVMSFKADNEVLKQKIEIMKRDLESINSLLVKTASQLSKSMNKELELQTNISNEQVRVKEIELQNQELVTQISELNNDLYNMGQLHNAELKMKEENLSALYKEIDDLNQKIAVIKEKEVELQDSIVKQTEENKRLNTDLKILQNHMHTTLGYRLKSYMASSANYPNLTIDILSWIAFCILPAAPAPKIGPYPKIGLGKFMGIVKR